MNVTPQILAGLVGGLIAALASVCAVLLTGRNQRRLEEARWKREDQARFHLYRRELYARFLSSVSTMFQSSSVVVQFQGNQLAEQLPQFKEQKQLLLDAMATLTTLWEEVSLVGSPPVVGMAKEINGAVAACRLYVYLPKGKEKIEETQKAYQDNLRPQFLRAARIELGISTDEPIATAL